jgi:hypothetical protein
MGDGRTRVGPSMAIDPPDEIGVLNFSRSSKGTIGTSRRGMGGGEERAGLKREGMTRRLLSARNPRASPCSKLPTLRNLEVKAKTWNIVNSRCWCWESKTCLRWGKSDEWVRLYTFLLHRVRLTASADPNHGIKPSVINLRWRSAYCHDLEADMDVVAVASN